MDLITIFKALANESRLQILTWLKDPKQHFPEQITNVEEVGVCVGLIQQKSGLSQSTVSHFLAILLKAGLVKSNRIGQWTYYQRNETAIQELAKDISQNI